MSSVSVRSLGMLESTQTPKESTFTSSTCSYPNSLMFMGLIHSKPCTLVVCEPSSISSAYFHVLYHIALYCLRYQNLTVHADLHILTNFI